MTTRLNQNTVEIGSLTYTERDALTGVQTGTIAYISDSEVVQVYDGTSWQTIGDQTTIVTASGGNSTDTSNRPGYTTHIFTSPGTLTVSSGYQDGVDAIVVGGGGGAAVYIGSGGGGGGMRLASFTLVPGTYEIEIGSGGAGGPNGGTNNGKQGGDSYIRATSGGVGFSSITGTGGGGGGGPVAGTPGGSGGGLPNGDPSPFPGPGPANIATDGAGNAGGDDPRCTPASEGEPGGWTPENGPFSSGNGGGGAGEIGTWGAGGGGGQPENQDGGGGNGLPVSWTPPVYGSPSPLGPGRWFAGGGGGAGGQGTNVRSPGGAGGGAPGANTIPSRTGGTADPLHGGGGGGGWALNPGGHTGGAGGSGIVMISYPSPANA